MNWQTHVRLAESMLHSSRIPGSEEIISLIKGVNPTPLQLSEPDRERGYRLKNELQNLLLENYGESFRLDRHPYSDNILLIKHRSIPTIDACHTHIRALSMKALDALDEPSPVLVQPGTAKAKAAKEKPRETAPGAPPREVLCIAQRLLVEYDYTRAEELLTGIRIGDDKELPTLIKAVRILVEEMGAYESAAATMLSQPRHVLKDKQVRELLALTYYGRGMIPEARALLDSFHPDDLGKSALFACAEISFLDGNLSLAHTLLQLSEAKEGILPSEADLKKRIEECMRAEAEPLLREGEAALARCEPEQAKSLIRQALAHYPHYQEARHLLRRIEAMEAEGEIATLWSQYEASATPHQRLESLARLLELDRNNEDRIRAFIAAEKAALKQRTIEERLHELRTLATREEWSGCFDTLLWLSRQDDTERLGSAFEISPHFSVLYRNRKLLKVSDEEAKEIWLSFVAVKSQLSAGKPDGCLERLEKIKRYFHSYPYFREEYDRLLESEQEAAKIEVHELLAKLLGSSSLAEARAVAARARRATAKLPADKIVWYRETINGALDWHIPENSEEENLEDYRRALLVGNAARAASLRDAIADADRIALIDRELEEYFTISVEPIAVISSQDAPIDLATEPRSPLTRFGESGRHVLYREDEETIIIINLEKLTAARYRSPRFRDLGFLDALPARDLFLFVNTATNNNVWRAKLSETEARFCAEIVINENYIYEPGASFAGMLMSSSKDNDYYAFIQEGGNARAVKQSLDVVSSAVRCFHIKGEVSEVSRMSYHPDSILIGTDDGTFLLNSNLDIPHGSSRVAHTIPMHLFAADLEKFNIYIRDQVVKVLNSKLKVIKQYPNSIGGAFITSAGIKAVCTATDTALVSLATDKGSFYDLNTDKFSQVFPLGRVLWTGTPTKWHCFDYDKDASTLAIREITHDLDTLLEWQVICTADQDDETQLANVRQLEDPLFFNLPVKTPAHAEDA